MWLTIPQAMERASVRRKVILRWIEEGLPVSVLPGTKARKIRRIRQEHLADFMNSRIQVVESGQKYGSVHFT